MHWGRALECGTKDKRGREVPLEGIGVFGMEGCRKSSCLGGQSMHICVLICNGFSLDVVVLF